MSGTIRLPARALWHSRDPPHVGAARLSVDLSEERGAAASPKSRCRRGEDVLAGSALFLEFGPLKRGVHGHEFPLRDFLQAALDTNFGWAAFCMTALKLNFRWAGFCMTALKANFGCASFCRVTQE